MKFRNKTTKVVVNVNDKNEWLVSQYNNNKDYEKVPTKNALDDLNNKANK